MEFSRPEYWSGYSFPSPGHLPNPAIKPRSPTLQADSLPVELQEKPKNTGVGSLFLLLTQESNWSLQHCRQILYQLSYEGSPQFLPAAAAAKSLQSCPTLCDPMGYTVYGILQARILEWVAFLFSRGSSQPRDQTQVSCTASRFFTS